MPSGRAPQRFVYVAVLLIVTKWTKEMMRDEETSKYVDGIGFHWYFADTWLLLDGAIGWNAVDRCVS